MKYKINILVVLMVIIIGSCLVFFDTEFFNSESKEIKSNDLKIDLLSFIKTENSALTLENDIYLKIFLLDEEIIDSSVNRKLFLRKLFEIVTKNADNQLEQIELWTKYLQDRIVHIKYAPTYKNGQAIYDPYWIIKNKVGHCGQTNRVLADGLNAAGFETRIVQLKSHVGAEVRINDKWLFLDADWLNLGQFIRDKNGNLVSADEIYKNPDLVNHVAAGKEFILYPVKVLSDDSLSYKDMFTTKPYYYYKTATRLQEDNNIYYGWNYYKTVK